MPENYKNQNLNIILKQMSILYVEDENHIRENVKKVLLLLCKEVYDTDNSESAKTLLKEKHVDIIISDINLPNLSGLDFIKQVRQIDKTIPVILLSAYTDKEYLLEATKLKLIDYLTKPVDFKTLNQALQKSIIDILDNSRYIIEFINNVKYNVLHKKLYSTDEEIPLTSKELILLDFLIKNKNRVISHEELKNNVWENHLEASDSALKNLLNKIRKKIGKESISNISGVGFRILINKSNEENI